MGYLIEFHQKKIMNNVPNYESNHNYSDSLVNSDSNITLIYL